MKNAPVEAVLLTAKEVECSDLVQALRQQQRQSRCKWKDFAVLYRQHLHRDDLVEELAEAGIPFAIENMDMMDTAHARDLFACLGAVVSTRRQSLPGRRLDSVRDRSGKTSRRHQGDSTAERNSGVASVLAEINGAGVLDAVQRVRDEIARAAHEQCRLNIILRHFRFNRTSPPLAAILDFVSKWEEKPTTKTGEIGELLEYLEYFREARG